MFAKQSTTNTFKLDAFELLRRVIGELSVGRPILDRTVDKSETLLEMIENAQVAITRQDEEALMVRTLPRKQAETKTLQTGEWQPSSSPQPPQAWEGRRKGS